MVLTEELDITWPSNNEWGVPVLDSQMQAVGLVLPFKPWGSRKNPREKGTQHFYVHDYRFASVWQKPQQLLATGAKYAVEVNWTVSLQSPKAYVMWSTFMKRWLSRYWQSKGIRILVDLNVPVEYSHINLLGVPTGWKAYCTRGYNERLEGIVNEWEVACERAQTKDILFVVYGGGRKVKEEALKRSWLWMPEQQQQARGKV